MKITYYFNFFELEAEDTRDQLWIENFIKNNLDVFEFAFVDESNNTYSSKEIKLDKKGYLSGCDIPNKLIIGRF